MFDSAKVEASSASTLALAALMIVGGIFLNYQLERQWPGGWAGLLTPAVPWFLVATGVVVCLGAPLHRPVDQVLLYAFAIGLPFSVIFLILSFGVQFVQTGSDRLGECTNIYETAATPGVVPQSLVFPSRKAIGCGTGRRGMFLSYYNEVSVYGVADRTGQDQVLQALSNEYKQNRLHPMHVTFYETEKWVVETSGRVAVGHRTGPEKVIRNAAIG